MKDLQSSRGGLTRPASDDPGLVKGVVVRNKGVYGRRIGIFTDAIEIVAGAELHAADYRLTPEPLVETDGYLTAIELELAGNRTFHNVFSFDATSPFETMKSQMSEVVAKGDLKAGVDYVPSEVKTLLPTGKLNLPNERVGLNYFSFTMIHNGKTHELGLDVSKHPAKITADLNYALAEISPDLRGLVSVTEPVDVSGVPTVTWNIAFAVGSNSTLRFPMTNVIYQPIAIGTGTDLTSIGYFQPVHLNNQLTKLFEVTKNAVTSSDSTKITDPNFASALTVQQLVDGALLQNRDGSLSENGLTYSVDIQKTSFAPMKQDTRFKVKLIMLSNTYSNSDFRFLQSVDYLIDGVKTPADLLVVPRGDSGYGTRLIDVDESIRLGKLVGASEQVLLANDAEQALPETGGSNYSIANGHVYGSRFAIAVMAQGESYKRFSPLYRETVGATSLVLTYTKDSVPMPQYRHDPLVLDWSKDADALVHVGFTIDTLRDGEITKVKAIHSSATITDVAPVLVPSDGKVRVDLNQGFSARALTFDRMSGSIDFITDMKRPAMNQSAETLYELGSRLNYTVVTPVMDATMVLDAPRPFVIDVDNNDRFDITGQIETNGLDHNTMYYIKKATMSVKLNTLPLSTQNTLPVIETDNNGAFTVRPTYADLSDLGVGKHTLEVSLQLTTYWNEVVNLVDSVIVEVLPKIEGVEDDFTFITPAIANGDLNTASKMRLIDSDTLEVLAEGNNVNELTASALALGLVDIDLIKDGTVEKVPEDLTGNIRTFTKEEKLKLYAPKGLSDEPRGDGFFHKKPVDWGIDFFSDVTVPVSVDLKDDGTPAVITVERKYPGGIVLNANNPMNSYESNANPAIAITRAVDPWYGLYAIAEKADPESVVYATRTTHTDGNVDVYEQKASLWMEWGPMPIEEDNSGKPIVLTVPLGDVTYKETYFESDGVTPRAIYDYKVIEKHVNDLPAKSTLPVGVLSVADYLKPLLDSGPTVVSILAHVTPTTLNDYSVFAAESKAYYAGSPQSPLSYLKLNQDIMATPDNFQGTQPPGNSDTSSVAWAHVDNTGKLVLTITGKGEMVTRLAVVTPTSSAGVTLPPIPGVTTRIVDESIPEIGLFVKVITFHIACAG